MTAPISPLSNRFFCVVSQCFRCEPVRFTLSAILPRYSTACQKSMSSRTCSALSPRALISFGIRRQIQAAPSATKRMRVAEVIQRLTRKAWSISKRRAHKEGKDSPANGTSASIARLMSGS